MPLFSGKKVDIRIVLENNFLFFHSKNEKKVHFLQQNTNFTFSMSKNIKYNAIHITYSNNCFHSFSKGWFKNNNNIHRIIKKIQC